MASLPPSSPTTFTITHQLFNLLNRVSTASQSPHYIKKKSRCFASTSFFFRSLIFTTLKNPLETPRIYWPVLITLNFTTLKNPVKYKKMIEKVLITLNFTTLKNSLDVSNSCFNVLIILCFTTLKNIYNINLYAKLF